MSKIPVRGLLPPTEDQLSALVMIQGIRDWPTIRGWLEDSLKALGGNQFADEYAARWAQGSGQTLTGLLEHVDKAAEKLNQMRNPKVAEKKPLIG